MKNLLFTLLLAACSFGFATAQSSFSLNENPHATLVADTVPLYESKIKITNLTAAPLPITWHRTLIDVTNGVSTQVCDKLNCYFPQVSDGMFTMDPSDVDTFKIQYSNWGAVNGNAFVHLTVTNGNNSGDVQTAMFMHVIGSSSGVHDVELQSVKVYPNPVSNYFMLENNSDVSKIRMFNADGREVASFDASSTQRYDIAQLPAGNYFLLLVNEAGKVFKASELMKL